jgi:hypothetical protein
MDRCPLTISFVSGDLSMRLLLTTVQLFSKWWSTSWSATISIIFRSTVTILEPMVLWSALILTSANHCSKSLTVTRSNGLWAYTLYFGQKE